MTRKQKRSVVIFGAFAVLAIAAALVLSALSDEVTFFKTPTDLVGVSSGEVGRIRLGGVVVDGSVDSSQGSQVKFAIKDAHESIQVRYTGILPDLFREGQGVVAEGKLDANHVFIADTVLAKHDEKYMPKEVADRLKEQGYWKGNDK